MHSPAERLIEAMNHALRTPLGVALGLLRDVEAGYPVTAADLRDGVQALERIESVLGALRDLSRCDEEAEPELSTLVRNAAERAGMMVRSASGRAAPSPLEDRSGGFPALARGLELILLSLRLRGADSISLDRSEECGVLVAFSGALDSQSRAPRDRAAGGLPHELAVALGTALASSGGATVTIREQDGSFHGIVRSGRDHNPS